MQINPSGSAFGSRRLFSDTTCGLNTAEKKNRQTEHTESYMKGLAQSGKDKDPDADKIREIVDKARMGRKLNQDELNYLREKSPDNYRKIIMAMQEREMLRQQMFGRLILLEKGETGRRKFTVYDGNLEKLC